MTLKENEIYSYYCFRVRCFEQATRWVNAYAELYKKYEKNGASLSKFEKIRVKGQKAWERLVSLL